MRLAERILAIKQQIAAAATAAGRDSDSVKLLAVSKQQPVANIREAYDAGLRAFGENYLQEALPKIAALADLDIEWHYIGHIQSNKTRKIAEQFAFVQSVSSLKIAERLNEQRPSLLPPLNVCIEVNLQNEPDKSGIAPQEVRALAEAIKQLPKLNLRGLMAIPAASNNETEMRSHFHALFSLYQTLKDAGFELDTLSMGMSADFTLAIAEGSTLVRVGTAIFGERKK